MLPQQISEQSQQPWPAFLSGNPSLDLGALGLIDITPTALAEPVLPLLDWPHERTQASSSTGQKLPPTPATFSFLCPFIVKLLEKAKLLPASPLSYSIRLLLPPLQLTTLVTH